MHKEARQFIARMLAELPPRRAVIEIGSRDINGSIRDLFAAADSYVGIDIEDGRGVDLVADGATYQPDELVDTVVCCEALEHVSEPEAIVANAARMLAPGGVFLLTAATDPRTPHSAVDGAALREGEHYQNISEDDIRDWLTAAGFTASTTVHARGDLYVIATMKKPISKREKDAV